MSDTLPIYQNIALKILIHLQATMAPVKTKTVSMKTMTKARVVGIETRKATATAPARQISHMIQKMKTVTRQTYPSFLPISNRKISHLPSTKPYRSPPGVIPDAPLKDHSSPPVSHEGGSGKHTKKCGKTEHWGDRLKRKPEDTYRLVLKMSIALVYTRVE